MTRVNFGMFYDTLHKFHLLLFEPIKKGTTGIEPVTTGTAVLCSTTELSALNNVKGEYN